MEELVVSVKINDRVPNPALQQQLENEGIHALLARLWANRGVSDLTQIQPQWQNMLAPSLLSEVNQAASLLADAIEQKKQMLIIADYDCDGATACALGIRAMRQMGANIDFLVPNRFETGYGLSPAVVDLACRHTAGKPDILITVDNGIASVEGVEAAKNQGMDVIITDHHLPGDTLPAALCIVNPNKPGCNFPSKNLAGVGVIFYVMLALRAEMRKRHHFAPNGGPRLDNLADLLALGTVADVVKLDGNNRLLVTQGLKKIRSGQVQPGIKALFMVAGSNFRQASTMDLGFKIGPRINAAGRLADMSLGIRCLTTDDETEALSLASQLDDINHQRRSIEQNMNEQALNSLESEEQGQSATICVFNEEWHQGVVGIVASRLKEKFWKPTLAFAPADNNELRGSGRSVPEVHLRDVLDLVSKRHPGMILKFGGHAMAAGLSLKKELFDSFSVAFNEAVQELSGCSSFDPLIETDGSLETVYANAETAALLQNQVWGAGFPAPLFRDTYRVRHQRLL
ncbi:MAG: single-stranded-DNA-specific exonuclease RecJ, partial [Alcaligenaceae bacterium]|nr:single-stranded-DNA-specific exonuclease RecJ [Alcaligenaceae bacterium]